MRIAEIDHILKTLRHDGAYCHCHRHYLPDSETRRNRLIRNGMILAGAAAGAGWLSYHFVRWASEIDGAMRVSL